MRKLFLYAALIFGSIQMHAQQSVGIGTTTPNSSAILDVSSTTKGLLLPRMTAGERMAIGSPAPGLVVYETTSNAFFYYNGTGWAPLGNGGGSSDWLVNGTHIYNGNTGNVGIGLNAPTSKFHVLGNILMDGTNPTFQLRNAGVDKGFIQLTGDYLRLGTNSANNSGRVIIRLDNNDRVIVDSTGNTQILGLQDASLTTHGYLTLGSLTGDNLILDAQEIQARNNGNADDMVMQNEGGNIGIGVFPPKARLHVMGNAGIDEIAINTVAGESATMQFYQTLAGTTIKRGFVQLDGEDLKIGTNSGNVNGRLIIRTDGADRMFVDEAGNVSIGTTNTAAGYKFHVGGKAICEELKVQLISNWPDYVFKKTYKLLTIAELDRYVQLNNHLPGIPPAKEIESTGMEVGDMQKRMMEKIEELTLYVIQLKKEIDELKSSK